MARGRRARCSPGRERFSRRGCFPCRSALAYDRAVRDVTQLVPNVHELPGHIAWTAPRMPRSASPRTTRTTRWWPCSTSTPPSRDASTRRTPVVSGSRVTPSGALSTSHGQRWRSGPPGYPPSVARTAATTSQILSGSLSRSDSMPESMLTPQGCRRAIAGPTFCSFRPPERM